MNKNRKIIRFQGLSFKEELQGEKIDFEHSIKYLSLVPWEYCNWSCIYCHQGREKNKTDQLSIDEMKNIIEQASNLGVKSLLLLGGEVLLKSNWSLTSQIVQIAYDNNLITVIYTNGSQINSEMAEFLADRNVSIALKVDSINEEKYDKITQKKGSFRSTKKAIKTLKKTSIGNTVYENENEKLVLLLFSTVGCSLNISEYVSLARFATNHNARWMMEFLNHRGNVVNNEFLSINLKEHSESMRLALTLNPEQYHNFNIPCRLLSCITIRKNGEIAICPQDYNYLGNIRKNYNLKKSIDIISNELKKVNWREDWTGECPIKEIY